MWCFDPSRENLAVITEDTRIKIWDVSSGSLRQQYVEPGHLSKKYTAVAWIPSSKVNKKSKKRGGRELGKLAVGTDKGEIIVWDLQKGEVKQRLGGDGEFASIVINDIAITSNGARLFSSSDDKHVLEWDLTAGKLVRKIRADKSGVSKLALSKDDSVLATASTTIKLWDLASGEKLRRFRGGHASNITALAFSEDGHFVFSASANERFINIYAKEGKEKGPVQTLAMESCPSFMVVQAKTQKKGNDQSKVYLVLSIAAGSGDAYMWSRPLEVGHTAVHHKPHAPDCTIKSSDKKIGGLKALAGCFSAHQEEGIVLARGSDLKPSFAIVEVFEKTGNLRTSISLEPVSSSVLLEEQKNEDSVNGKGPSTVFIGGDKDKGSKRTTNIIDEEMGEEPSAKRQKHGSGNAEVKYGKTDSEDEEPAENMDIDKATPKKGKPGAALVETESSSSSNSKLLGEIVADLDERLEAMRQSDEEDEDEDGDDGEASENAENPFSYSSSSTAVSKAQERVPEASSLVSVVEQALQTKDNALLEYCLNTSDSKVIRATVARLPTGKVLPFLSALVSKLERRPTRGSALFPWLRALLYSHTSYLMTVPDLVQHLAGLYQNIDSRVAVFKKVLKLSGRLDLLLSQITARSETMQRRDNSQLSTEMASVYDDEEEEEDESDEE